MRTRQPTRHTAEGADEDLELEGIFGGRLPTEWTESLRSHVIDGA